MLRGVYAAAAGMINQRERLDVISNNLANVGTTGYKRSQPVSRGFYQIFADEIGRFPSLRGSPVVPGGGSILDVAAKDFSPGPIVDTGNPLDVAIDGPGFFVVSTPSGERYTRAGNFSLNPDGLLVTQNGELVLGEGGVIVIQGDSVTISPDGSVIVDGEQFDRISIVDFPQPHRLTRYGHTQFAADEETARTREPVATPSLRVGSLEHANVNPISELVAMMDASRSYEAHQRVIIAMNESLDSAVNEIARA